MQTRYDPRTAVTFSDGRSWSGCDALHSFFRRVVTLFPCPWAGVARNSASTSA